MSETHDKAPYDAGDAKSVRERTTAAKRRQSSRRTVIRQVMDSNEGRAWIYEVLARAHIFQNPYSRNALDMAFACGEMNMGQQIIAEVMDACPGRYLDMLKEANDE